MTRSGCEDTKMLMNALMIVGILLGGAFVASATGVPFLWLLIGGGLIWALSQGGGAGLGAAVGTTLDHGRRGLNALGRFLLWYVIWVGLMIVAARFMEVPLGAGSTAFRILGPMPWNWGRVGNDYVMFACAAFIAAGIAMRATRGRPGIAVMIFLLGFSAMWIPKYARTTDTAIRNPKTFAGPTAPRTYDETFAKGLAMIGNYNVVACGSNFKPLPDDNEVNLVVPGRCTTVTFMRPDNATGFWIVPEAKLGWNLRYADGTSEPLMDVDPLAVPPITKQITGISFVNTGDTPVNVRIRLR